MELHLTNDGGNVSVKGTRYMVEARWRQTKGSCMCCTLEVSSKLIQVIRDFLFIGRADILQKSRVWLVLTWYKLVAVFQTKY